ncbi:MAG: hypothetical protein WD512_06560 [Candidatus Paceibacterota bacterium]
MTQILKVSNIADFYVDKKKFNAYKKDSNKKSFVERTLKEYLHSLVGVVKNGVEIRYCDITSNNFWGEDLHTINDLGYSFHNPLSKRKDKLTFRVFQIDLIGIVAEEKDRFEDIKEENFILATSSVQII